MKPWNVIRLRDYQKKPRERDECRHEGPFIIDRGVVECEPCGKTISAYKALEEVAHVLMREQVARDSAARQLVDIRRRTSWLRAVKNLDRIWRGKMLPCCPHCRRGIEAEKMEHCAAVSRDYERSYLQAADKPLAKS